MELPKGKPLTFQRWEVDFSPLSHDHGVVLDAQSHVGHLEEGILSPWL